MSVHVVTAHGKDPQAQPKRADKRASTVGGNRRFPWKQWRRPSSQSHASTLTRESRVIAFGKARRCKESGSNPCDTRGENFITLVPLLHSHGDEEYRQKATLLSSCPSAWAWRMGAASWVLDAGCWVLGPVCGCADECSPTPSRRGGSREDGAKCRTAATESIQSPDPRRTCPEHLCALRSPKAPNTKGRWAEPPLRGVAWALGHCWAHAMGTARRPCFHESQIRITTFTLSSLLSPRSSRPLLPP